MYDLEKLIAGAGMDACEITGFIIHVRQQTRKETIEEIKTRIDKILIERGLDDFEALTTMCKAYMEENSNG